MQLHQLFTEKYRPQTMEEMCLPERHKTLFEKGITQNYIFNGTPGTGKSSLAKVLSKQFKHETLFINASSEGRIDYIREEISSFASTAVLDKSKYSEHKLVILDEVDGASLKFFEAFRSFVEKFSNVRFILTSNNINKIPDYIQSRFHILDFNFVNDKKEMTKQFGKRLIKILKEQDIKVESKDVLLQFIEKHYPKYRNMLVAVNELKDLGIEKITEDVIQNNLFSNQLIIDLIFNDATPEEIYKACGKVKGMEAIVIDTIYEDVEKYLLESSDKDKYLKLFNAADVIRESQYNLNFVKDKHIVLLSCVKNLQDI